MQIYNTRIVKHPFPVTTYSEIFSGYFLTFVLSHRGSPLYCNHMTSSLGFPIKNRTRFSESVSKFTNCISVRRTNIMESVSKKPCHFSTRLCSHVGIVHEYAVQSCTDAEKPGQWSRRAGDLRLSGRQWNIRHCILTVMLGAFIVVVWLFYALQTVGVFTFRK